MISEALNFAATWILSPRKVSAEINSSVMLRARAMRCRRPWAEHEARCHAVVRHAVDRLERKRVCVVLGSGLLLDVPIRSLSEEFETVLLFDLQHLASVRLWARAKGLSNLRFMTRDLSGASSEPGARNGLPLDFLDAIADVDLVISANLLSQIAIGLHHRFSSEPEDIRSPRIRDLLGGHVRGLGNRDDALLLTDTDYVIAGKDGRSSAPINLLHGLELPPHRAEWHWTVAPYGELDPSCQAVHRVVAIDFMPSPDDPAPGSR